MERRKHRGGRGGRRKSKEFMDAAVEAYIRHLALEKWREITDLQESSGMSAEDAVREAGDFSERGPYREIWAGPWTRHVIRNSSADPLFAQIETAVKEALGEEIEARHARGDALLEDTSDYKRFIDHALEHLFKEAAGTIEEL